MRTVKRYEVVTADGLSVYGPDGLVNCKRYLKQALLKGSEPGFLQIKTVRVPASV